MIKAENINMEELLDLLKSLFLDGDISVNKIKNILNCDIKTARMLCKKWNDEFNEFVKLQIF